MDISTKLYSILLRATRRQTKSGHSRIPHHRLFLRCMWRTTNNRTIGQSEFLPRLIHMHQLIRTYLEQRSFFDFMAERKVDWWPCSVTIEGLITVSDYNCYGRQISSHRLDQHMGFLAYPLMYSIVWLRWG